jgi:hypothetical protein
MSKSTNKRGVTVRDRFLYFETDVYFGRALDTKVMIDNQLLCWIAGDSIDEFIEEFAALLYKFSI